MLRNSKDQAFYGAPLVPFPHLATDYVEWFCKNVGLAAPRSRPRLAAFRSGRLSALELLGAAADALRFDFTLEPKDIESRFASAVEEQIDAASQELLRVVHGLTPLQVAVLRVLAERGADYRPFEASTLEKYEQALARCRETGSKPDVPAVQAALTALQEKSLVWKSVTRRLRA